MDLRWHEQQQAFQARVLIEENPDLALRPYRTFVGTSAIERTTTSSRAERLTVVLITGTVLVTVLLAFGITRELIALIASFMGGIAVMVAVTPPKRPTATATWTPLLAVYSPSVMRGARPICVTEISIEELDRLGTEGFGTVVGKPGPGATFGLFVDSYLVWPRTPPRAADESDPGFGTP